MNENSKKIYAQRILIYIFFGILTILSIIPFWIVLVNATRTSAQIQQGITLIPQNSLVDNWNYLIGQQEFEIFDGYLNSFIIAGGSTLLSVYFSSLTAYGLTVYEFKGKKIAYSIILLLIMIPTQVSMIGFYQFMAKLNLLDSFVPLILPSIASAPTVFFMKQYLETIYNPSFMDAARIDGAGELKIFHTIILPLMRPAIATMSIFSFIQSWNNFLMPQILITSEDKYTLPMLIQQLTTGAYRREFGAMYLGITMTIIPLLIAYLFLSRYIIGGVTAGGIKE